MSWDMVKKKLNLLFCLLHKCRIFTRSHCKTVRFEWKYTVDNRNMEFSLSSLRWDFYDSSGGRSLISVDAGAKG
jgi:hypothetical protein